MFQWDKAIKTLDVPVDKVVHLFRSMRDVQLALPGLPAQEASAYLCQYQTAQGVGTAAVFHLHKSNQLTFYVNTPREVAVDKAESMLDQALVFVESMGFLLTDLDIHLLGESDREMLWLSLPLQRGVQAAPMAQPEAASPAKRTVDTVSSKSLQGPVAKAVVPSVAATQEQTVVCAPPVPETPPPAPESIEQGNVDDLLAAVEALRNRRPGVRARKKPPSAEELKRRRQELRENFGRILASL